MPVGEGLAYLQRGIHKRGEILLGLSLLQSWGEELPEMNRGREGGRYRYSDTLIKLQFTSKQPSVYPIGS